MSTATASNNENKSNNNNNNNNSKQQQARTTTKTRAATTTTTTTKTIKTTATTTATKKARRTEYQRQQQATCSGTRMCLHREGQTLPQTVFISAHIDLIDPARPNQLVFVSAIAFAFFSFALLCFALLTLLFSFWICCHVGTSGAHFFVRCVSRCFASL